MSKPTEVRNRRSVRVHALVVLATVVVGLCWSASSASAAASHPFLAASSLDGADTPGGEFDKACGVAVDSEGDVYVASAGQGAIRVFDSSHNYLASIADANEPCGLAVDSSGRLYVSERASGNVVRYDPSAYPFAGSPTYGAAVPIDSSGTAKGIAVVPATGTVFEDSLFVAEGDHVAFYNPSGELKGSLGQGELTDATGVAAWTNWGGAPFGAVLFISVADPGQQEIQVFNGKISGESLAGVAHRATIDGSSTPDGSLHLSTADAYLGLDPSNGHLFALDATDGVVNEFEATGGFFSQLTANAISDAKPTAIAVDRSGGVTSGDVYVTSGAGAGSEVLAFGPVVPPTRAILPEPPSQQFSGACGAAVDKYGNLYAAGESEIQVYSPSGAKLTSIIDPAQPCSLAVDQEGNLYVADRGGSSGGDEKVVVYKPQAFPLSSGTTYSGPTVIDGAPNSWAVAVDPTIGDVYVTHTNGGASEGAAPARIVKYHSAADGSGLMTEKLAGLSGGEGFQGIAVDGSTGDVYVDAFRTIRVFNSAGTEEINSFPVPNAGSLAIDESSRHLLVSNVSTNGHFEEYEFSGALIGTFGSFAVVGVPFTGIAVDNSGGPSEGRVYLSYRKNVTAFGSLKYGEAPEAETGVASGFGGGAATVHGTVDPNGFELETCQFELVTEAEFQATGFSGATQAGCEPGPAEIGAAEEAVAVQAQLSGLDLGGRYRYRLVASNKFGSDAGGVEAFGPPVLTSKGAQPVSFVEATLRGLIDPAGLDTTYFFEYGTTSTYGSSTAVATLPGGVGAVPVEAALTGLAPGATYHFRLVAENSVQKTIGPDQSFTTVSKPEPQSCANATLRLENNSTRLPDCRAYELVTPADLRGAIPTSGFSVGNTWRTVPYGPATGGRLTFGIEQTLPGTEGNGLYDMFRSSRGADGWINTIYSPSKAEAAGPFKPQEDIVAAGQLYSVWGFAPEETALSTERFLRTPGGFELLGVGSLGEDPHAVVDAISPEGEHVIFSAAVPIEPNAPAAGIVAIYDRSPGGPTHVVSLLPGNGPQSTDATFLGATEDVSSVVFSVGEAIYLRRDNVDTLEVSSSGTYAGISGSGGRVFYEKGGSLFAFDAEADSSTEIAPESRFAVVSADGSRAYFLSEESLDGDEEAVEGEPNLYVWDGSSIRLAAVLGTMGELGSWSKQCVRPVNLEGWANCPVRSNPDGSVLVFESRVGLTGAEAAGHSEVYRYDTEADPSQRLSCVSCNPTGAAATGDANLENVAFGEAGRSAKAQDLIPNVTEDGRRVFFEAEDSLVPEDANSVTDVYEWQANGTAGCERGDGCLFLISSGQSNGDSRLYTMTPDGHDVFFTTEEKLVNSDIPGSRSIYDARVEGGFPAGVEAEPCEGDACQGEGSSLPSRPTVRSDVAGSGNVGAPRHPCRHGRKRVKGRCVAKHSKHHHKKHRHKRGGATKANVGRAR